MCRVSFTAAPGRCADDLGVRLFICSAACCLYSHSWSTKLREREKCKCVTWVFWDTDGARDPVCVKTQHNRSSQCFNLKTNEGKLSNRKLFSVEKSFSPFSYLCCCHFLQPTGGNEKRRLLSALLISVQEESETQRETAALLSNKWSWWGGIESSCSHEGTSTVCNNL